MTDQITAAPKVTGAPDTIYLVYGELDEDVAHSQAREHDCTVLWCEDRQFPSDVKYVRADLAPPAAPQGEDDRAFHSFFNEHQDRLRSYEDAQFVWQAALAAERAKSAAVLAAAELDLCRQWFDNVQDVNGGYLDGRDFKLAVKLYGLLKQRVPHSVLHGAGLPIDAARQQTGAKT
jgi:hypothetical protein